MSPKPNERHEELRRVYRTHVRAVFGFLAYSVTRQEAEDLTSTTFERVIRAWDQFDPHKASERTWVLAIARNALTDHFRRQRIRTTVSTDEHPALLETLATSDDALARHLTREGIIEWLRHLGPREREVLAMRFGADLSAREVAASLGISESNAHQISSRALRHLRELAARTTVSDSARPAERRDDPA